MTFPKISIVTPVFNQVNYLEFTIKSVLEQNYPNLEYIIIDGGSTDGTIDIIKKYEKQLYYWVSEPDNGMYEAIQKGFGMSTGEIMAWINADDMYHRNSLYTVAEIFSTFPKVSWLLGEMTQYDKMGRTLNIAHSPSLSKYDFYMLDNSWIQQESCFWRKSLWNSVCGLNTKLKYAGDFDLWLRFISIEKLYVANVLIAGFRLRGEEQLSQCHIDEYMKEVNLSLSSFSIAAVDKKILHRYRRLKVVSKFLIFKFLRKRILRWFRIKHFNDTEVIRYDFENKCFRLYENPHQVMSI